MNNGKRVWSWLTIVCMALVILTACGGDDPDIIPVNPTPNPTPNPEEPVKKGYPTVTVIKSSVNVFGGVMVDIRDSVLIINEEQTVKWVDESGKPCKVQVFYSANGLTGKEVKKGDILDQEGKLAVNVTNEYDNSRAGIVTLVVKSATENFTSLNFRVGEEVNLLDAITFEEGITLLKTEMEIDGVRSEIPDPTHFAPTHVGDIALIFTVQNGNGPIAELKYPVTIKPMEYQAVNIQHLKPKDILPVVGQVNSGDGQAYNHIEHLRIAECTHVRDMMWQYGAGSHSAAAYQSLMLRLNTGMIGEKPAGFDNFEVVGKDFHDEDEHGHNGWDILCSIIDHANLKVLEDYGNSVDELYNNLQSNAINIFAQSKGMEVNSKEEYDKNNKEYFNLKKYIKKGNFLWFVSGSNLSSTQNKIYQEDLDLPDEKSMYCVPQSQAHNKNDAVLDKHIMLTIGTNANGDADITDSSKGSRFPVGFHPDVLFSGRAFPQHRLNGNIYGEQGNYTTSYPNYTNLAMTDLCFQMYAEVADVDQLMNMIRSTSLTNYIRLNGQTQDLHLINPAGFFLKYLMPTVPATLTEGTTASLSQGYYHGVVFNIPGAEVNINGEWVPFTNANFDRIKKQNPFTLQWRLNSEYLPMMGYTRGTTITGQLIAVDDQWHGLNITQDVTITIN